MSIDDRGARVVVRRVQALVPQGGKRTGAIPRGIGLDTGSARASGIGVSQAGIGSAARLRARIRTGAVRLTHAGTGGGIAAVALLSSFLDVVAADGATARTRSRRRILHQELTSVARAAEGHTVLIGSDRHFRSDSRRPIWDGEGANARTNDFQQPGLQLADLRSTG